MVVYRKRIIDDELQGMLETFGATLIVGAKWCGKTTTGLQKAKSVLRLQDPDTREANLVTASIKPSLLLRGDVPRMIDEWQDAPVLWDSIRVEVDSRGEAGQFILTGSTVLDLSKIKHSGIGRIARLKMYPMSLYESEDSNGKISIKEIFNNESLNIDGIDSELSIEELIYVSCRGGWPVAMNKPLDKALLIAREYIKNICEIDMLKLGNIRRNPTWAKQILKSYARNVSTLAKKTNIYNDLKERGESLSLETFNSYVEAFKELYVIEDLEAWSPTIRSATTIRTGPKRGFCDPSIAVAALGLTPRILEEDLKTFGFIFECLCIRDLKIYTQALGGTISYYRDRYNLEADAVIHLADGKFALVEFKVGSSDIDEGARHLLEIKNLIKEYNGKKENINNSLKEPDLLMIITGGEMAYTRQDGVKVIPIGCLKD